MNLPHYSRAYENWAPVVGRAFFGILFLFGAVLKIPGTAHFTEEVGFTASAGVPFALIAVTLAFILEVIAGIALIIGWKARTAAFILAIYTVILTLVFYHNFNDILAAGNFVSHLGLIAGLLYISVYGAQYAAVSKNR